MMKRWNTLGYENFDERSQRQFAVLVQVSES
jgi:hypothetical protein